MQPHSLPTDRLAHLDFAAHNTEVQQVWQALNEGRPIRTPIVVGTNSRYFLFNGQANPSGISFQEYSENPRIMFDSQLQFQRWSRHNILQDAQLGLPQRWSLTPDFQNYYEAGWFGCPIVYLNGQVPDTTPGFTDRPERIMDQGLPDPFGGLLARGWDYFEQFKEMAAHQTYCDIPIDVTTPGFGLGTDGVMTVACNLFGPEFVCTTMVAEPQRLHRLFEFITEATIQRMTAWRKRTGISLNVKDFGFADDSIALISTAMYRQHVLPHHRRLCDALCPAGQRSIHLCGDATRHFLTIRDELNVWAFDTGFPVNFGQLRRQLGPKVRIYGGPHVELLRTGKPAAIHTEVQRIMQSGILDGGLFVLREGNNLAPFTPLENIEAMYHAGKEFGDFNGASSAAATV
jgi:uroporphyrinogen-III decarboxylase